MADEIARPVPELVANSPFFRALEPGLAKEGVFHYVGGFPDFVPPTEEASGPLLGQVPFVCLVAPQEPVYDPETMKRLAVISFMTQMWDIGASAGSIPTVQSVVEWEGILGYSQAQVTDSQGQPFRVMLFPGERLAKEFLATVAALQNREISQEEFDARTKRYRSSISRADLQTLESGDWPFE